MFDYSLCCFNQFHDDPFLLQHLTGDRGEGGLGLVGRQLVSLINQTFLFHQFNVLLCPDSIYLWYYVCANFFWKHFSQDFYSWDLFSSFFFTYFRDFPRFSFALKQNAHPWLLPFRWEELAALEGLKSVHTSIMNSLRLDHSRLDKQKRRNKKNCSNSESFAFWEI